MKLILFFVQVGIVLQAHREAARSIAAATGCRVVFRNANAPVENIEPNTGVAGKVPPHYANCPRYTDAGALVPGSVAEGGAKPTEGGEVELNAIGLPKGAPDTREALCAALDAAGIAYHGRTKTEKLVELYKANL
jgi:hypothetical protein